VRCTGAVRKCGARVRRCAFALMAIAAVGCASPPAAPTGWTEPTTGLAFVLIPAGEFTMGSPASEPGHQADERLHRVRLSTPFYLSTHEVTRRQWDALMSSTSPVAADPPADTPIVNVNWFEARRFIDRLNDTGQGRFRLPTEAEWEYACRAGTRSAYAFGETLSTDQANYNGRFPLPGQPAGQDRGALTRVGSFSPNAWGLYDMHGNVWEWTEDPYCDYAGDGVDPSPTFAGPLKVIRGGSWRFNADSARSALRYTHPPADRGDSVGFRVVLHTAGNEERRTKK
jgi:formylglycine-generating enzyme required for sulfatase activity